MVMEEVLVVAEVAVAVAEAARWRWRWNWRCCCAHLRKHDARGALEMPHDVLEEDLSAIVSSPLQRTVRRECDLDELVEGTVDMLVEKHNLTDRTKGWCRGLNCEGLVWRIVAGFVACGGGAAQCGPKLEFSKTIKLYY